VSVVAGIVLAVVLLMLFAFGRALWRFFRGDEQMEAGGSQGRQLFGRDKPNEP
jgi:hypothetical protein